MADNKINVGNINDIRGDVNIAGGDIHKGFSAEQVSNLITQITSTFEPKKFDGKCPYKGLDAFEEEDANLFFGREKLVDDLVSRVKDSRTVFITGPSGSGKSSLVRAGLLYALKRGNIKNSQHWLYATMKPGREPMEALATALSRIKSPELGKYFRENISNPDILNECAESALTETKDQRLVLFLDQFEEVFTQLSPNKTQAFINLITNAANSKNGRIIVLFSMRSDFVSNCATYPDLNELLNQQFVQIGAMGEKELVSAIAQPALRVGLRIDPDLIAQIINDMQGEPGALPLMQFALKDLFDSEQARGGLIALTLEGYLEHGGIHKALERHADDSFAQLGKHEQELARSIFSGLIEIGRGTQDTRRTALFDELVPADTKPDDIEIIVRKLADARLITTDEQAGRDTVSISHEKLIDAWPWLKKLVNENRDVIALQNEIAADAKEWNNNKRDKSYLYTGARLANVHEQLITKKLKLSGTANEFVLAGQIRQRRNQWAAISGIITIMILLVSAVIIFSQQSAENARNASVAQTALAEQYVAATQRAIAEENQQIAEMNQLIAEEKTLISNAERFAAFAQILQSRAGSLDESMLLAIKSYQANASFQAENLIRTNSSRLAIPIAQMSQDGAIWNIEWSPDYEYFVTGNNLDSSISDPVSEACVYNAVDGNIVYCVTHKDGINDAIFSMDGKYLITASADRTVKFWDASNGDPVFVEGLEFNGSALDLDVSESVLAIGREDNFLTLYYFDQPDLKPVHVEQSDGVKAVEFSPSGDFLAFGMQNGQIRFWQVRNNFFFNGAKHPRSSYVVLAWSPDSLWLVSGGGDSTARLTKSDGTPTNEIKHQDWVEGVAFAPDSSWYATASDDNMIRVINTATGAEKFRMSHSHFVQRVIVSSDGQWIASTGYDKVVRIWDSVSGYQMLEIPLDVNGSAISFNQNADTIVAADENGNVSIWDISILKSRTGFIEFTEFVREARFTPSGEYLIVNADDYNVWKIPAEQVGQFTDGTKGDIILTAESLTYDTAISPDSNWVAVVELDTEDTQKNRGTLVSIDGDVQYPL